MVYRSAKVDRCISVKWTCLYDDSNIITTFEILELTDDTMVLCWNPSDAEAWTDATFWCLRKNNFNTHSKTGERQGTPPFDVLCLPFLSINYRK